MSFDEFKALAKDHATHGGEARYFTSLFLARGTNNEVIIWDGFADRVMQARRDLAEWEALPAADQEGLDLPWWRRRYEFMAALLAGDYVRDDNGE